MAHNASGVPSWTLADRLRKIRRDRGMAQHEIAALLGIKPVTWSAWEAGRTRPQDVVELAGSIERRFGVPAAWTLGVLATTAHDESATNPAGIPAQRPTRRWDDHLTANFIAAS